MEVPDDVAFNQRQWLVVDGAVRQGLLELPDAFVGDVGEGEAKVSEARQPLEVIQTGVGDFRAAEL